ncbi:MAG: hypothetical protein FWC62_06935 [Firmicutes bacterium]|nr:hypothetical protein [Bacillota bacterium]
MFDFTELSPYFTGAGGDTIGDILQQYGTPDKLLGGLDTYGDQWVEIDYPLLTLRVTPNDSDEQRGFSFATRENSGKKASEFPITSRDKTISLAVVSVRTIDPKTTLPRGLAIGQSTRAQVTAVYPTGSGASMSGSGVNAVEFSYVWFKTADFGAVGGLVYEFDGSDILTGFTVNWFYFTP